MRVGGGGLSVQKTLKRGGAEKSGGETKLLKSGGKVGHAMDALKLGRLGPSYELCPQFSHCISNF